MREFSVHIKLRKGLGPDWVDKHISVGLDDIPEEMTEVEIRAMVIEVAEEQLYKGEDYQHYGKNWQVLEVYSA